MSIINRCIIFTAASVLGGLCLELQLSLGVSDKTTAADKKKIEKGKAALNKAKTSAPKLSSDAAKRLKWERSTFDSSCGVGRNTNKVHGGSFALEPKERNVIGTMAVFVALSSAGQSTSIWPSTASTDDQIGAPTPTSKWENSHSKGWGFNDLFKRRSHCRYSGKSVVKGDIEEISGVKISTTVKTQFEQLKVVEDKILDLEDIMFEKITGVEDVSAKLSQVLDVDNQCDSPACRSLMKKYLKLNNAVTKIHAIGRMYLAKKGKNITAANSSDADLSPESLLRKKLCNSPFYHIYQAFQKKTFDQQQLKTELSNLPVDNRVHLVMIGDLDLELALNAAGEKIISKSDKPEKANTIWSKYAKSGSQHAYFAFDCTDSTEPFMKVGIKVMFYDVWLRTNTQGSTSAFIQTNSQSSFIQRCGAGELVVGLLMFVAVVYLLVFVLWCFMLNPILGIFVLTLCIVAFNN